MLIGLSGNSPFFDSELTGLTSTRKKIFEGLHTAGPPPIFKNYSEFQKLIRTLQKNKFYSIHKGGMVGYLTSSWIWYSRSLCL